MVKTSGGFLVSIPKMINDRRRDKMLRAILNKGDTPECIPDVGASLWISSRPCLAWLAPGVRFSGGGWTGCWVKVGGSLQWSKLCKCLLVSIDTSKTKVDTNSKLVF